MLYNAVFSLDELESIKQSKNERTKDLLKSVLSEAENVKGAGEGASLLSLGFAYYYTGDIKYVEKAKEVMHTVCSEDKWYHGGKHGGFEGNSELGSSAKTKYMALGYALFKEFLTEDERKYITGNTYKKGIMTIYEDWILPDTRIHSIDTMGHNWWIACVSAGVLAATIMKDEIEKGEELVRIGCDCCEAWFKYEGNPINTKPVNYDEGGFWEGLDYINYSLNEYLLFANVYKRVFGKHPFDDEEIIRKMALFILHTYYPSDKALQTVPFGDTNGAEDMSCPALMIRYGLDIPEIIFYLKNRVKYDRDKFTQLLIWDKVAESEAKAPKETSACYSKIGWATFRDSFENNSTLLAIKCGDTWNHAHADAASFVLYKDGALVIGEGGGPQSYSVPAYQGYYVQSIAHNTVLFEGKGQDYRDNYKDHVRVPGKLVNYKDCDGFRYVAADATGPMGRYFRKHQRHFLWIEDIILIYDDIECYEKGTVNYLIHEEKEITPFRMLTPCEYEIKKGYKNKSSEINCEYKSYNLPTGVEDHAKFVSALCLDESKEPQYEEFEKYIKVTYGDIKFYVNKISDGRVMHKNCFIEADGYKTDATILIENGGKVAVVNGSIVRQNGKTLLGVFARINGYI